MEQFRLSGSPEIAARINAFDWSSTPLGPRALWPQSLVIALNLLLGSRFPMQLLWGDQYVHFYNDAYIPIAADKHPGALGRPGAAIWPEIWAEVLPMLERVRATGEPSWSDDQLLVLRRWGDLEEGYFTFSYSPIYGDGDRVDGVFVAVAETTRRVIGERRLRTIRDLGAALGGQTEEAAALLMAGAALGRAAADLPFALLYLVDDARASARLALAVGVPEGHPAAPAAVLLSPSPALQPWPFGSEPGPAAQTVVHPLDALPPLPGGPLGGPAAEAMILPLAGGLGAPPLGWLVAGLSPRLRLDDDYRDFLGRVAGQVAAALAYARAHAAASADLRVRDDFLSIAAHELKTPLTPIIGKLQLAQRRLAREGLARRHLDDLGQIAAEAGRLAAMIDALLDVSRLRSGQLAIDVAPVDLGAIAAQVVDEVRPTLSRQALSVDAPAEPAVVEGDALRLTQALRNLLSNAVKYSPQGGAITVEVAKNDVSASVAVRDEGVGIPPEALPAIFDRYYRVESADAAAIGGLGLGLFVVHEIVRRHGGSVTVESAPDVGSCFTIVLPLRQN